MRVLFVVHQFPPLHETGTETLCLRTAQALKARGHDVLVATARHDIAVGRRTRRRVVDGVDVVDVPTGGWRLVGSIARRLSETAGRRGVERVVANVARDFAPDLVHVHHAMHFGFGVVPRFEAPVVYTVTDRYPVCPFFTALLEDGRRCHAPGSDLTACVDHCESRLPRPLRHGVGRATIGRLLAGSRASIGAALSARGAAARRAVAASARLITASTEIRDDLLRLGADPGRVRVAMHAVPPTPVADREVAAPLRIGFYGTFLPHKGAHVLLDALKRLPPDLPFEARLWGHHMGKSPYRSTIERMAASDPRIRLCERVPQAAFGTVLGWADVVVVPSLWSENAPLVLMAALEARRYVVVSDGSGLASCVPSQREGRVVRIDDPVALADALRALLGDPRPVVDLRDAPRPESSFPRYVDMLLDEYDAALEGRPCLGPGVAQ